MKHEKPFSLRKVHILIKEKKYKEAQKIIDQNIASTPDLIIYHQKKAELEKLIKKNNKKEITTIKNNKKIEPHASESTKELKKLNHAQIVDLAKSGNTHIARSYLTKEYQEKHELSALLSLAKLDLIDGRFSDATHKCEVLLQKDKRYVEAYKIAEQASIEIGDHQKAKYYFLGQPKVKNPEKPRERGSNPTLPSNFVLPPPTGPGNDYTHILEKRKIFIDSKRDFHLKASIIIPVFNRYQILANTLAALTHQTYPKELIEIIIVDDGSSDNIFEVVKKYEKLLNIIYCRQPDKGFRVAAARNLGIRQAKGDVIIFIDADILPLKDDIKKYMEIMHVCENCVLIGHRRYVETSSINDELILKSIDYAAALPSINPNNDVADRRTAEGISFDWRYEVYKKTDNLKKDLWPFTKAAGGNIAFNKKLLDISGDLDEDFEAWGCEDSEHAYRLYNAGAYFIPLLEIESLHQEPLRQNKQGTGESFRKKGHTQTKLLFAEKCPAPTVRSYAKQSTFNVPKVSIYIPCYNADKFLPDAINSCLNQTFGDIEICICDDGSTDNTLNVLEKYYSHEKRVRWISQENKGIGNATNTAISMCRGMYIAQLDADDILKPNAVKKCVEVLDNELVDAVYTDCDYIDENGNYIRDGWCGGDYSREWMATGMIATHFRMFRKRLWNRTSGCDTTIKNAVDLDLWLKFYEKSHIKHIHEIHYSYRWHGSNTSLNARKEQEKNHLKVVANSFKRLKLETFWEIKPTNNKLNPREFRVIQKNNQKLTPEEVVIFIPTCEKYKEKAEAIKKTWGLRLKKLKYKIYYLIGDPSLKEPQLHDNFLFLPCRDDYESLILKLFMAYDFAYQSMEFKYIYKIDDDCYLNIKSFEKKIIGKLNNEQYIGISTHPKGALMNNKWHFGKCSHSDFNKPYIHNKAPYEFAKGGYSYLLRRDVLPFLIKEIENIKEKTESFNYYPEDVKISEILGNESIFCKKLNNISLMDGKKLALSKVQDIIFDIQNPESIIHIDEFQRKENEN